MDLAGSLILTLWTESLFLSYRRPVHHRHINLIFTYFYLAFRAPS
jgi:hypothetical protein